MNSPLSNQSAIRQELQDIIGRRPAMQAMDVVAYARYNQDSAIRQAFDARGLFDDAHAAEVARLAFARQIIQRVKVRLIAPDKPATPLRVYVNLKEERLTEAGGYRMRAEVLVDGERLDMLRRDFAADLEAVIRRYCDLLTPDQEGRLRQVASEVAGVTPASSAARGPALHALKQHGYQRLRPKGRRK